MTHAIVMCAHMGSFQSIPMSSSLENDNTQLQMYLLHFALIQFWLAGDDAPVGPRVAPADGHLPSVANFLLDYLPPAATTESFINCAH